MEKRKKLRGKFGFPRVLSISKTLCEKRGAAMKTIIITGGGGGVGRATAHTFLKAGWRVGLIGRRAEALEETAGGDQNALILPCDVRDEAQVQSAFDKAAQSWGHLDVLFNNAGVNLAGAPPDEISIKDWRNLIDINVTGSFICARAAFGQMRHQTPQGGRIINNGSVSAYVPRWGSAPYSTSKHAITGLTKAFSLDGRPFNIACGQIDIGNALTDMAEKMTKGVPQADGALAVEPVMDVTHAAKAVLHMAELPLEANVQFMTVMASAMPYIGRG
jgi:NAD(P)-dependent dehydrogenase (short-subunit alcohol dehydrogenase family)